MGFGSIFPIFGHIADAIIGKNRQEEAFQQNMELQQRNFDFQERMWNLQNEYNTPLNQLNRFRDAGLNPNLIYTQGTSGNSSSLPSGGASHVQQAPPTNLGMAAAQALALKAQQQQLRINEDVSKAQIGLINANAEKTQVEAESMRNSLPKSKAEGQFYTDNPDYYQEYQFALKDTLLWNNDNTRAQTDLYKSTRAKIYQDIHNNSVTTDALIDKYAKEGTALLINAYANKQNASANMIRAMTDKNESEKRQLLLEAQTKNQDSLRELIEANTNRVLIRNGIDAKTYQTQIDHINQLFFNAISTGNYIDAKTATENLLRLGRLEHQTLDNTYYPIEHSTNVVTDWFDSLIPF